MTRLAASQWALITGGDGYLGRRLARRWLDAGDGGLVLTVRAADAGELAAKRATVEHHLGAGDRVAVLPADLAAPDPFATLDPALQARVTSIVHAGAVTVFNVDRPLAEAVNVVGTERVVELARRCPRLETLTLLSSVYASGLRAGVIEEAPLDDGAGFANFYEWSKWESEQRVLAAGADLPWRILRVATVVADGDDGRVGALNAVHQTLRLCFYGLISLLPGSPTTPLYLVTGDFVTDAVLRLADTRVPAGVYHAAHRREESLTLERLIGVAYDAFEEVPEFRARRVLRPLLVDEDSFAMLVAGVKAMSGSLVRQALDAMAPFARQLYVDKDVRNERARAVLGDHPAPDAEELVRRMCAHLVATGWGRRADVAV